MTLSVEQVIQKSGLSIYHIKVGLIAGLIIASDSASTVLLRILDSILLCDWRLSELQQFRLFNAANIGMAFGAPLFGLLADLFGRKPILQLNLFLCIYLSLISSASQSYLFALCIRAFIGVSLSGCLVPLFTLYAEFLPIQYRGILLMSVFVFDSVGVILQVFLSVIALPYMGWRWWVAMCTVPFLLVALFTLYLSESPRYLMLLPNASDRLKELCTIIHTIQGERIVAPSTEPSPSHAKTPYKVRLTVVRKWRDIRYLFQGNLLRTSIILTGLWFMAGLTYFGSEILSIEMNLVRHHCLQNLYQISILPSSAKEDRSCCSPMNAALYQSLALVGLGAFASVPLGVMIVHVFGRTRALTTNALFLSLFYLSLGFCLPTFLVTVLFLSARGFSYSLYATLFVYTVEVYPTWCRGTVLGIGTGLARVGALVTYAIGVVFLHRVSVLGTFCLYSLICAVMAMFSLFLQLESKGEHLPETFSEAAHSQRRRYPKRQRAKRPTSSASSVGTASEGRPARGVRKRRGSDSTDYQGWTSKTPSTASGPTIRNPTGKTFAESANYNTFDRRRNSS